MICNNYANAFTKFPTAKLTDNFEKALNLYEEALSVRTADDYPTERAITLLNFLEASWKVSNPDDGFNIERFNDMRSKAIEVRMLTSDEHLFEEAARHMEALDSLENQISQS